MGGFGRVDKSILDLMGLDLLAKYHHMFAGGMCNGVGPLAFDCLPVGSD
jgi:hypothetical protein